MTNRKVQQVLRRVAEATPSGKLPSERESDALRLVRSIGGVARTVSGRSGQLLERRTDGAPVASVDSKPPQGGK